MEVGREPRSRDRNPNVDVTGDGKSVLARGIRRRPGHVSTRDVHQPDLGPDHGKARRPGDDPPRDDCLRSRAESETVRVQAPRSYLSDPAHTRAGSARRRSGRGTPPRPDGCYATCAAVDDALRYIPEQSDALNVGIGAHESQGRREGTERRVDDPHLHRGRCARGVVHPHRAATHATSESTVGQRK